MGTPKKLLVLAVSHDIHLTPGQRRRLADGGSVGTVGVSVPVWYSKGYTSEPASEVFCNYILHNTPAGNDTIFFKVDGYEFNLPQLPTGYTMPEELGDREWADLEPAEREALAEERQVPVHGRNLLDVREGGSDGLAFSRTATGKMRGITTTIHHTIRISDLSDLEGSFLR